MRLIYCDASLQSNVGHFATHCRFMTQAFRSLGVETIVLAHKQIDPALSNALGAQGAFSLNPYSQTSADPICGWLKTFADVTAAFSSDFARIEGLRSDDILFYDTVTPAPLMGLLNWAQATFKIGNCPRIVAALIEHSGLTAEWTKDGARQLNVSGTQALLYRYVGLSWPESSLPFRLISYDRTVADVYANLVGRPVLAIPHPYEATTPPRSRQKGAAITVGFIGAQRENKGFHLVPDIVEGILRTSKDVNVLVHNSWGVMQSEMDRLTAMAKKTRRMKVAHESKDEKGWAELLSTCDLLVAPYDRRQYAIAISGITFEAFANGIPVVVPTRTAMAEALKDYGEPGIAFEAVTVDGVVRAIKDAISRYAELEARARIASQTWAEQNGPRHVAEAILRVADHE